MIFFILSLFRSTPAYTINPTQYSTGRRVNEQAKRLDHITRALRIEAPEAIAKKYAEQVAEDRAVYKVTSTLTLAFCYKEDASVYMICITYFIFHL